MRISDWSSDVCSSDLREGLLQQHAQHRTGEIGVAVLAVHDELARTGLDPDAGNGVLALAGRIGADELVELGLGRSGRRGGNRSGRVRQAQVGECTSLGNVQSLILFFGWCAATSSSTG